MKRARAVVAFMVLAALSPCPAPALGARAVEGVDRARLLPPAGARIEAYANAGYRLRWIGDEIEVSVDTEPLDSQTRFEPSRRPARGPIERLAKGLTASAETYYEAVSHILGWVARNLEYDLDRGQPQTAEAVLERRSGYCTGVARLTVALLTAVDIDAREVAGYVVGSEPGRPRGYHRWIEAYLPDRGWVFSDPLATHHYVPATYLRLAAEDLEIDRGTEGLLLERRDAIATVDLYPLAPPGVTARRSSARQLAAALRVRLEDQSTGTAVLEGRSERWTHALVDGKTTFVGLDPGSYQLRLLLPGRGVFESPVELPNRIRKAVLVTAPALRADRLEGTAESPENSSIKRDR
jgi:Transglutaminase-like superfamily